MNTFIPTEPEIAGDADLVGRSLDGDRDAFGHLVARYQSAICAMSFSACGDVERSEDVAQEVFLTAWRRLGTLREADKFKPWLYGIARNLINNSFRQQERDPVGDAEVLNERLAGDFDFPDEQTISKEEQAILWHVLSGLPRIYREPMVLFYRQNESVPAVADILGISEEAARQRLSRGRVLLAERVTRVIRSGLRRSGPGGTFTLAVVAALPILAAATTAQGAVMGAGTVKGTAGNAGWLAALKGFGIFAGILAIPAAIGGLVGRKLGKDAEGSGSQRAAVGSFWRVFGWIIAVLLFVPLMLALFGTGFVPRESRLGFLSTLQTWLAFSYAGVVIAIAYWIWMRRRARKVSGTVAEAETRLQTGRAPRTKLAVACVGAFALGMLIFCLCDMNFNVRNVTGEELAQIIEQNKPADLNAWILQCHPHSMFKSDPSWMTKLWLEVRQNGKVKKLSAPSDDATVNLITSKGLQCPTYVQGRDFEILGTPGRMLPFLLAFLIGICAVYLIKQRKKAALH